MFNRVRACTIAAVVIAASGIANAAPSPAAEAFSKITALEGEWSGTLEWTGARQDKGTLRANYYVTGVGSAVVENLIMNEKPGMTTVYHLDGADLRMTQYCAAHNQPRLKASKIDNEHGAMDFAFVDATNLPSPDAPHVIALELRLIDKDHITLAFLFDARGKQSREFIDLHRVSGKSVVSGS